MLDQSNLFFDWSNPNFDQSNFENRLFKRLLLSRVLHIFKSSSDFFSLLFFDQSNLRDFCCFLPQNFPRFLSSSIGKTFIPFLFQFNYMFHAFFFENFKHRKLGIFYFSIVFNHFVDWVFVLRYYKHDSYALIWLICWFENNWKF